MTTMLDVYEAAGAEVNDDRTMVSMKPGQMRPFEIVITVMPGAVEMIEGEPTKVTFDILLDPHLSIKEGPLGAVARELEYVESLTLPVDQVRIHKEDECANNGKR